MKSNQSIHISIKEPPNPKPIRSLGLFENSNEPSLIEVISQFIKGFNLDPKDPTFVENVKDEAMKLLATRKVIAVAREGQLEVIYLKAPNETPNLSNTQG